MNYYNKEADEYTKKMTKGSRADVTLKSIIFNSFQDGVFFAESWIPINTIPVRECDVLFRNDNQKGMCRFYTGRYDNENGFWSHSGYTDQTHYRIINL